MIKSILKGLVLSTLALALVAASAAAQIGFQIGAGMTIPQGDYGDAAGSGWNAMGAATFTLPALPVKIRADLGYHSNPSADDAFDVTENIISLSGDAMFSFAPGPISPYILGGVTWGSASASGDDAVTTESSTDFGYNIGGGLNFGLGPLKLFAEARWMSIGDADMVPITVGIHF